VLVVVVLAPLALPLGLEMVQLLVLAYDQAPMGLELPMGQEQAYDQVPLLLAVGGGPSPPQVLEAAHETQHQKVVLVVVLVLVLLWALQQLTSMPIQCPFDPAPDPHLLWPWPWLDHSWLKVAPEMTHSNQQVQMPSQSHESLVVTKEDAVEWHQMHLGHHVTSQP